MIPGYHAGELWLHNPLVALNSLSEMGYRAIAIRPRQGSFVPDEDGFERQWQQFCLRAMELPCQIVVDTEAMFIADSTRPFFPSLVDANDRLAEQTRIWLERWITLAAERPGTIVSFASGPDPRRGDADSGSAEESLQRLADQLEPLCQQAESAGIVLAMRPAARHVIGSVAEFERFQQWLPSGCGLGLAADVGEMLAAGELPLGARLQRHPDDLRLVYLCDQRGDGWTQADSTFESPHAMGRRDVPIGSGDVSAERLLPVLDQWDESLTVTVRVAGRASAGLQTAADAMQHLREISCWAAAAGPGIR